MDACVAIDYCPHVIVKFLASVARFDFDDDLLSLFRHDILYARLTNTEYNMSSERVSSLRSTLQREEAKLVRQEKACADTETMIAVLKEQIAAEEKKK